MFGGYSHRKKRKKMRLFKQYDETQETQGKQKEMLQSESAGNEFVFTCDSADVRRNKFVKIH